MSEPRELYFEICDGGDLIRLELFPAQVVKSSNDWDDGWIPSKVTIKGGAFSGQFYADFIASDFEYLKRDIKKLDQDFTGSAKFEPLERQLMLDINGDGLGHFEVKCTATDHPGHGGSLSFTMSFDQTELARLINELDKITEAFPWRDHRRSD